MEVYMALFDWSTTDNDAVEVELFDNYEKAYNRFCEIILNEQNPEMSWVGKEVFEINGIVNDGYIFDASTDPSDKCDLWWNVTDEDDYNRHVFLDLRSMEVK